jgi:hypothetical protein
VVAPGCRPRPRAWTCVIVTMIRVERRGAPGPSTFSVRHTRSSRLRLKVIGPHRSAARQGRCSARRSSLPRSSAGDPRLQPARTRQGQRRPANRQVMAPKSEVLYGRRLRALAPNHRPCHRPPNHTACPGRAGTPRTIVGPLRWDARGDRMVRWHARNGPRDTHLRSLRDLRWTWSRTHRSAVVTGAEPCLVARVAVIFVVTQAR